MPRDARDNPVTPGDGVAVFQGGPASYAITAGVESDVVTPGHTHTIRPLRIYSRTRTGKGRRPGRATNRVQALEAQDPIAVGCDQILRSGCRLGWTVDGWHHTLVHSLANRRGFTFRKIEHATKRGRGRSSETLYVPIGIDEADPHFDDWIEAIEQGLI